jgi:Ser/Thr protein kinase RdoA (MazF antagonist)
MISAAPLVGAGREAEILEWGEGRVLRLLRDPAGADTADDEAAALRAAGDAGAPVPGVYERVVVDGRPGIVMERIEGTDLLSRIQRRPWTVRPVGRALGRLHARLHTVAAPPELVPTRERLAEMLRAPLVPEGVRDKAEQRLAALPDGDRLCHGDLHPGNVIGGRVIDWTAASAGDPAADVARTCLLLAAAATPTEQPAWKRAGEGAARFQLTDAYLRAYRRERPLEPAAVERWLPVLAAARLTEGIEPERGALLRLARAGDALRVPGRFGLDAAQRRWIWLNAVLITAVLNVAINAGLAWATAGDEAVPLWSAPVVGGPSTITDTAGTLFLLPLITCLLVTTAVRREVRDGRLARRVDLLHALPRNRLLRGAVFGAFWFALLAPPAILLIVVLGFGDVSPEAFVVYKVVLSVLFGALVTPFIAIAAMND